MKAHTAVHLYLGVEQLGYLGHLSCLGREPRLSTARGTLGHLRGLRHGEPAKSLNAVVKGLPNPSPSFTTTWVSEISNHDGAICTMGIGCTTGGDRGLLDFLSVTVGLQGEANVVWADAVNQNVVDGTSSALIAFNRQDRKSTRLNSSHGYISYAVFCLKKKKKNEHFPVQRQYT